MIKLLAFISVCWVVLTYASTKVSETIIYPVGAFLIFVCFCCVGSVIRNVYFSSKGVKK